MVSILQKQFYEDHIYRNQWRVVRASEVSGAYLDKNKKKGKKEYLLVIFNNIECYC
jgi:hypothetical protein